MSDFDFDEIDKAVNGALGTNETQTSETAETPETAEPEQRGSLTSTREESSPEQPASTSMPAARRGSSGRFMDMVHPSSDMRRTNAETSSPATSTTSRSTVEPASRIPEPPTFYQEAKPAPAPVLEEAPTQEADAPSEQPTADWSSPLESPFLPDAKVEKRPLGGIGDAPVPQNNFFTEPKEELLEEPEEELKIEASGEPLLEAHTLPDPIDFSESKEAAKVEEAEKPAEAETVVETNHDVPSPALEEEIAGPASITQQYKEQPSDAKQPGAIYDTESYHQPLTTPPKKRSGAWVFLWIFLLVVVGAAAGAAIYLYVLPRM